MIILVALSTCYYRSSLHPYMHLSMKLMRSSIVLTGPDLLVEGELGEEKMIQLIPQIIMIQLTLFPLREAELDPALSLTSRPCPVSVFLGKDANSPIVSDDATIQMTVSST